MAELVADLAPSKTKAMEARSSSADETLAVDKPDSTDPTYWGKNDESRQAYWAKQGSGSF